MTTFTKGVTVKLTDAAKKMFLDFDSNVFDKAYLSSVFLVKEYDEENAEYHILPVIDGVKDFSCIIVREDEIINV